MVPIPLLLTAAAGAALAPPHAHGPFRADAEVALICSVSGAGHVRGLTDPAQACAAIKAEIDAARGRATRLAATPPADPRANWLRITLAVSKTGTVRAQTTTAAAGNIRTWPEQGVDVMDKPLDLRDIRQLGRGIAAAIFP